MSDEEFLRQVQLGLEPSGHRSNLRLAWLLVSTRPLDDATADLCAAIDRRARPLGGAADRELTARWARLVAVASGRSPSATTFDTFLDCHPHLLDPEAVRPARVG